MSVIKMAVDTDGTANVVSNSIDIQGDGVIEGVSLGLTLFADATPADGDNVACQVGFLSAASFGDASHDSRGILGETAIALLRGTAEDTVTGIPWFISPTVRVPVSAGERIFIHVQPSQADMTATAVAFLYVNDGLDARPAMRRR